MNINDLVAPRPIDTMGLNFEVLFFTDILPDLQKFVSGDDRAMLDSYFEGNPDDNELMEKYKKTMDSHNAIPVGCDPYIMVIDGGEIRAASSNEITDFYADFVSSLDAELNHENSAITY